VKKPHLTYRDLYVLLEHMTKLFLRIAKVQVYRREMKEINAESANLCSNITEPPKSAESAKNSKVDNVDLEQKLRDVKDKDFVKDVVKDVKTLDVGTDVRQHLFYDLTTPVLAINKTEQKKKYRIPDWRKDPMGALVISYKTLKGIPHEDRLWDADHYPRCKRRAKSLLRIFAGDFKKADQCMESIAQNFDNEGISWSLETIVKHAHEWKMKQEGNHGISYRKRLFEHFAKQRAEEQSSGDREETTAGQVLDEFRNLKSLGKERVAGIHRPENGAADNGNGESVPDVHQEKPVEVTADRELTA
jgi:hypothetical protein